MTQAVLPREPFGPTPQSKPELHPGAHTHTPMAWLRRTEWTWSFPKGCCHSPSPMSNYDKDPGPRAHCHQQQSKPQGLLCSTYPQVTDKVKAQKRG